MSSNTTRIADLPENVSVQIQENHQYNNNVGSGSSGLDVPTYKPMNVHPNPYGNSIQPDVMPLPEAKVPSIANQPFGNSYHYSGLIPDQEIRSTPQVRLPSRDIPMDTTSYNNDEEIQPNFIPKPKLTSDYVRQYENMNDEKIKTHEKSKKRAIFVDDILSELQIPLLISFLFFFFNLPIINTLIFKRFSFLNIYNTDGNVNFYGIFIKSIVFGTVYYFLQTIIHFLTDF